MDKIITNSRGKNSEPKPETPEVTTYGGLVPEKKKPEVKYKNLFVRLTPQTLNIDDAIKAFENKAERLLGVVHRGDPDGPVGEKTQHYHFIIDLKDAITLDGFKRRLNALGYYSGTMLNVKPYSPTDIITIGGYLFHEINEKGISTPVVVNSGFSLEEINAFEEHNTTIKERARTRKHNTPVWETIQYFRDNNNFSPTLRDIFTAYLLILRRRELPYPGKIRCIINLQTIKLHLCDDGNYPAFVNQLYDEIKYNL